MIDPCPEVIRRWWDLYPPVGVFIALLAVLGVLVPLFRDWEKIGRFEKAIWTFTMFFLVGLEIRSLYLDRNEHDREQARAECEQLERFGRIADKLGTAISASQSAFHATMEQFSLEEAARQRTFNATMHKSNEIALGVKEDEEAITGSKSYPEWSVNWRKPLEPTFQVVLVVIGKYPIRVMQAEVRRTEFRTSNQSDAEKLQSIEKELSSIKPIRIKESDTIPSVAHPIDLRIPLGVYIFSSYTPSGVFGETLDLSIKENGDLLEKVTIFKDGKTIMDNSKRPE